MTRKKVVLVIVEGPSDDTALGVMLNQVFDRDSVYVHILHGDITTRKGVNAKNIISKVGDEVKNFAKSQHYEAYHFKQIIHIIDTDGAYIDESNIYEDVAIKKVLYESEGIYTANRQNMLERNLQKRENLYRLRTTAQIWKVPYKVYYMSCNLDHVLYNKRNSTEDEKENDSYEFARKYRSNLNGFVKFMCESDFSVGGNHKESWEYIECGMNSLERHSNLGICITEEIK